MLLLLQTTLVRAGADLTFEPATQQTVVLVSKQTQVASGSLRLRNSGPSAVDVRLQAQCDASLRYNLLFRHAIWNLAFWLANPTCLCCQNAAAFKQAADLSCRCSPHQSPWISISLGNFTLAPSTQDLSVDFSGASLLPGVYSTRICAFDQSETGKLCCP